MSSFDDWIDKGLLDASVELKKATAKLEAMNYLS